MMPRPAHRDNETPVDIPVLVTKAERRNNGRVQPDAGGVEDGRVLRDSLTFGLGRVVLDNVER